MIRALDSRLPFFRRSTHTHTTFRSLFLSIILIQASLTPLQLYIYKYIHKVQQLSECRWWFLLLSVEFCRLHCHFHFLALIFSALILPFRNISHIFPHHTHTSNESFWLRDLITIFQYFGFSTLPINSYCI